MSYTSDAADEVIRIGTQTAGTVIRVAGSGAKALATMLYYAFQNRYKDSGVKRMDDMLENGKEFRAFIVRDEDIEKFCREARRIGVRYTLFRDQGKQDGEACFLVSAVDAARAARAMKYIGIGAMPEIKETEKNSEKKNSRFDLDYFVRKATKKETEVQEENPIQGRAEEYQSAPSLGSRGKERAESDISFVRRKISVKGMLAKYREEEKGRDISPQIEDFIRGYAEKRNVRGKERLNDIAGSDEQK